MMRKRACWSTLTVCLFLMAGVAKAQDSRLGRTEFSNSGAAQAQEAFLRGLLLLHSFEYDDAAEAFREAQAVDPDFAMAYWGEAMTYNHPLWRQQDREKALEALQRLAPTLEERLAKAPTQREKDYLKALEVLYGEGSKEERDVAYAAAMEELHRKYPEDLDAAAFYALALLGTCHEGRDIPTFMKAAAIVEEVFDRNPLHPGAAHYLIHSYDDPVHAPLGLRPARVYAKIAPAAAHALHMPSHIFVAMGMWEEVVASNEASWEASEARLKRKNLGPDDRGYHALWWNLYGLLQQGRIKEAQQRLDIIEEEAVRSATQRIRTHHAYMRATYLVETRRWEEDLPLADTVGLRPEAVAADLYVEGVRALKRGDLSSARKIRAEMKSQPEEAETAQIMGLQLEALLAQAEKQPERALELAGEAARWEDRLPFDYGPPIPVKPTHELLGELLLEQGRFAEAEEEFRRALSRAPRRALSLLGLARAAQGAGHLDVSRQTYQSLEKIWRKADRDLAEIREIEKALAVSTPAEQ